MVQCADRLPVPHAAEHANRPLTPQVPMLRSGKLEQPCYHAGRSAYAGTQEEELNFVHLAEEAADITLQLVADETGDEPQAPSSSKEFEGCHARRRAQDRWAKDKVRQVVMTAKKKKSHSQLAWPWPLK
jgi:predicted GNAT family acetyltransferase